MTEAEQERAKVVAFIKLYGEINLEQCGDSILLDPVLAGESLTQENLAISDEMTLHGAIHSAQHHACEELIAAIERGDHRTSLKARKGA